MDGLSWPLTIGDIGGGGGPPAVQTDPHVTPDQVPRVTVPGVTRFEG